MMMRSAKAVLTSGLFVLVVSFPLLAEADQKKEKASLSSDWEFTIGLGVGYGPDYEGSDDYEFGALPLVEVVWKDRIYLSSHEGLGAYFYQGDQLSLKGGINYDGGRDESDNSRLRGLGDVDAAAALNFTAEYEVGPITPFVSLEKSLGGSDGLQIEFGVESAIPFGMLTGRLSAQDLEQMGEAAALEPRLLLGLSTTWVDDNYAESYFGVNAGQSTRSGLARYTAESGFKSVDFEIGVHYPLTRNWAINATTGYSQLVGDAADSPIVQDEGQFFGGLFVTYTF